MSIAVVIPAYNARVFLRETLDSVLAQTIPPDEVLVIDDGSTDDTADIAERYGPPVKVFRRKNARQGASRNFAAQEAKSEWLAFMDADDLWLPNKLERQMQELAAHPDADFCYTGRIRFFMKDGRQVHMPPILGPPAERIREELLRRATFVPSCVVIRRSVFLASGGFDSQYRITDDWDLWLRLILAGTIFASCEEPLLLYRLHPGNMSGDGFTLLRENAELFHRHVLPQLSRWHGILYENRFWGENQAYVAKNLLQRKDRRCIPVMLKAILHLPFDDPYRYKMLLRMLYEWLTGGFARPSQVGLPLNSGG